MTKLYTLFQDKKTIKNAVAIFAIVSFEQVVSRFGINCRNAPMWLFVPPCVLFVVAGVKSKNFSLLFNRRTSKMGCLYGKNGTENMFDAAAAFLYVCLPSMAWIIASFLNAKIWVCYRVGYDECGKVRACSDAERFAWQLRQRDAKFESQHIGLVMLTVSVLIQALVSWGHHWYCANPVKQKELNDLILEATRTSLEKFILERISNRLADLQDKDPLNEKEVMAPDMTDGESAPSLVRKKQEWLRCVDRQIDFCLNEYLTLDSVTIVYSEV